MTVIEILEQLEACGGEGSKQDKLDILELHRDNELIKSVFFHVFDPFLNFYVKKVKKVKPLSESCCHDDDTIIDWLRILNECATRKIVGNAAKAALEHALSECTEVQQKWCLRILNRNLRCGANEGSVEKTWPGLIKKFEVSLAETLKTTFVEGEGIKIIGKVKYPIWGEPKLDGLRLIAVKESGKVTLYTRNGNEVDTLPSIVEELASKGPADFVLDGEAFAKDWNESDSVMMSKKNKKDDSGMSFNVFDYMSLSDWQDRRSDLSQTWRYQLAADLINDHFKDSKFIKHVKGRLLNNEQELLAYYAECMDADYEGIMLKDMDAVYHFERSDVVQKVKAFVTYEGVIVGWYHGRKGSQFETSLGGFVVLLPNGVTTKVGGGMKKDFRINVMLEGPESYFGKILEVQAQADPLTRDGLTPDGRMRFPVMKRFREPGDVDPKVMKAYETWKATHK